MWLQHSLVILGKPPCSLHLFPYLSDLGFDHMIKNLSLNL